MNYWQLNYWARRQFNFGYGPFCAAVALVIGYRIFGREVSEAALEALVQKTEDRAVRDALLELERKGQAVRGPKYGPSGQKPTWLPTERLLNLFRSPHSDVALKSIVKAELAKDDASGVRSSPVELREAG